MYKMHTKRKGYIRNRQHSRRRHSLGRRSRRAGTSYLRRLSSAIPNLNLSHLNAFSERRSVRPLLYAISKTKHHVTNHKGTYNGRPSTFTGTMDQNGKYIKGNLFYTERNGKRVGVRATEFDMNGPCGMVTRINLDGTTMLDDHSRPIIEMVTCGSGHVGSHRFYQ
jgi:hypothetical protein